MVVAVFVELVLYLVLPQEDRAACEATGFVPYRLATPGKHYVGLRENLFDAIQRFRLRRHGAYVVETVKFTSEGLAHYTCSSSGPTSSFASVLAKQTYWGGDRTDYKVWHFNGDLPFKVHDEWGHELLVCEFGDSGGPEVPKAETIHM